LEIEKNQSYQKLEKIASTLISEMILEGVIEKKDLKGMNIRHDRERDLYYPEFHITLFRVKM